MSGDHQGYADLIWSVADEHGSIRRRRPAGPGRPHRERRRR
ncbi:hypothetical protein [Streptosporangium sp. NPDC049644]